MRVYYKVVAQCAVKCTQRKKIKHVPSVWSRKELMARLNA